LEEDVIVKTVKTNILLKEAILVLVSWQILLYEMHNDILYNLAMDKY
jgi:hypothetical protein